MIITSCKTVKTCKTISNGEKNESGMSLLAISASLVKSLIEFGPPVSLCKTKKHVIQTVHLENMTKTRMSSEYLD